MAGRKDKCFVCVTSNLTNSQASRLLSAFTKEKNKIAPFGRSTAAITSRGGIGGLLDKGIKKITGK